MAFGSLAKPPTIPDVEVSDPPSDSISSMSFSPGPTANDFLAVASWDNNVRVYEITPTGQSKGVAMYSHQAPVLSVTWSADGSKILSSGCDNAARMYDVASGQTTQVAQHDQPIRSLRWVNIASAPNVTLVTGSWDKTLKYWDTRSPQPVATIALPERLYSLDVNSKFLVAACADRQNLVYNLQDPSTPFKQMRSNLKWQTHVVRCFPTGTTDKSGFVIGSIEGRVGVCWTEGSESDNYSFRCHRKDKTPRPPGLDRPNQDIYAINSISVSPFGTVATAGSDGGYSIWDCEAKSRLKEVTDRGGPITASCFNRGGNILAYGISYDWAQGHQGNTGQIQPKIMLSSLKEEDVQKRSKKK